MIDPTPPAAHGARIFRPAYESPPRRVLVVDDEEPIRNAIGKFLKARGFDVVAADSGAGALDALRSERFDALLCDVRMPGMPGTEVVPRALEIRPDLAVLMLTAVSDATTAAEVLAHGAMDYLMKPIELGDLAKAVELALWKRDAEIQQRSIERSIRDEVESRTGELLRELTLISEAFVSLPSALVQLREAHDPFLRGHSQRVAAMSAAIAKVLGLPAGAADDLRLAGLLHDIGIIGIPEALLHKAGPLTGEEYRRVQDHLRIGMDILAPFTPLARLLPAIQDHHERWDGTGYPRRLTGEEISVGGRILAAADAFDALTSRRAYREPVPPAAAIERLSNTASGHLDSTVLAALVTVVLDHPSLHFADEAR